MEGAGYLVGGGGVVEGGEHLQRHGVSTLGHFLVELLETAYLRRGAWVQNCIRRSLAMQNGYEWFAMG